MGTTSDALIDGVLLGEVEVQISGTKVDFKGPARFFLNYQRNQVVWAEIRPARPWLAHSEIKVSSPGRLQPFDAVLGGCTMNTTSDGIKVFGEVTPLQLPIQCEPAMGLQEVTFALLDYPIFGDLVPDQRPERIRYSCGEFDVEITEPVEAHRHTANAVGSAPHRLTHSARLVDRSGNRFGSEAARVVLDTFHEGASFAAGYWIGMTLVEGMSDPGPPAWFQWGTYRTSEPPRLPGWYDSRHPEWIGVVGDRLLRARADAERWEVVRKALYWYIRSNGRGAGIDSSLILSQCALELLSWHAIVKWSGALSEEGFGQLNNTAERLRLALTLLGIPRRIPPGLDQIVAAEKKKDIADAIIEARNYLVHPTQSRSGKKRPDREYPWFQTWIAAQWLLELTILRLVGYNGEYRNRTRLREFDPIERVPWAS